MTALINKTPTSHGIMLNILISLLNILKVIFIFYEIRNVTSGKHERKKRPTETNPKQETVNIHIDNYSKYKSIKYSNKKT